MCEFLTTKKTGVNFIELKKYIDKKHKAEIPNAIWERELNIFGRKKSTYMIQYYLVINLIGADTLILGLTKQKQVYSLWIKSVDAFYQFNDGDKWVLNLFMGLLENKTYIYFDETRIKRFDSIEDWL